MGPRTDQALSAASPTPSARCVLWHAAPGGGESGELPSELLSSLTKRIGRVSICTDPYAAFAEACLIERDRRAAIQAGTTDPALIPAGVLLLVHPRTLPGPAEIIAAARLYAPSVTCWLYDRAAAPPQPKLRAIVESDIQSWTGPTAPPPPPVAEPKPQPKLAPTSHFPRPAQPAHPAEHQPKLRLAGTSRIDLPSWGSFTNSATLSDVERTPKKEVQPPPPPQTPTRRPAPVLTEEELHMLLSDDPLPAPRPNGSSPSHGGAR